jgi:hypothetical protein
MMVGGEPNQDILEAYMKPPVQLIYANKNVK